MRTQIKPFIERDVAAAARLLAERHRTDRTRTPALSSRFDDPDAVHRLVAAELAKPHTRGVTALRGDDLVGFLIGTISLPPPGAWYAGFGPRRSAEIAYAGYAAAGPEAYELYREMYAALAPFFLRYGAFSHAIELNAGDETAIRAWCSLGFGQMSTLAARDMAPVGAADMPAPDGIEIRRAGPQDIEAMLNLGDVLARHHNAAPIFLPYIPEETEPGYREYQLGLLEKPENAHWIAYREGRAVGTQTFHEPDFAELARPDRSIYLFVGVSVPEERGTGLGTALLRHSIDWARNETYEHCTLHFLSANISAARFWLRCGFRPLAERMVRHVDDRLAWAKANDGW